MKADGAVLVGSVAAVVDVIAGGVDRSALPVPAVELITSTGQSIRTFPTDMESVTMSKFGHITATL